MMKPSDRNVLAEKLAGGFDETLPLDEASTIPTEWYLDPLIYRAERTAVFAESWVIACRVDEVQKPGDFVTVKIAGEPIIVLRDQSGHLQAMSNVCRHRAAQVETRACGSDANKLRCHYHGWTYDTAGKLIGVPEFTGVCNFEREENALPSWGVDTWGPYVFVRAPWAESEQPLENFLSPLPEICADLGLERMKFVKRVVYPLNCNWKVFVDNYLDGCYHCNTLHPSLFGAIDYKSYRTECHANTVVQISPLRQAEDGEVGAVRKGRDAYYSWIWPNFMLNVYEGLMDMNLVLPLGPDKCEIVFDFFFEHTEGLENEAFIEKSLALAHQVQLEDAGICEEVQAGMESQSFTTGRFSVRREPGGRHFHKMLAMKLRQFAAAENRIRTLSSV